MPRSHRQGRQLQGRPPSHPSSRVAAASSLIALSSRPMVACPEIRWAARRERGDRGLLQRRPAKRRLRAALSSYGGCVVKRMRVLLWASAVIAGALFVTAAAHSPAVARSSGGVAPKASGGLDCNGLGPIRPVKPTMVCADPRTSPHERFEDNDHYIGHDEPSIRFVSSRPGTGNDITWVGNWARIRRRLRRPATRATSRTTSSFRRPLVLDDRLRSPLDAAPALPAPV